MAAADRAARRLKDLAQAEMKAARQLLGIDRKTLRALRAAEASAAAR